MEKAISQKLKLNKLLSVVTMLIGSALLIYMITVEDEPGALPFFDNHGDSVVFCEPIPD